MGQWPLTFTNEQVEQIRHLASLGCRNREIAHIIEIDDGTLVAHFSKLLSKARAERRRDLRKTQTAKAMDGDTTMLIWLGKNELEQTDKIEEKQGGEMIYRVVYEDGDPHTGRKASETPPRPE